MDEERRLSFQEMEEEDDEDEDATPSKTARAQEIIEEMLENSPVTVADIKAACKLEGISEKTAQRARKRLGAVLDYENGVPVWKMG